MFLYRKICTMGEVFVLADSAEKNVAKAFKRESGKMDKLPICIQCLSNYDTDAHIFEKDFFRME